VAEIALRRQRPIADTVVTGPVRRGVLR
jgi:hypothetical protein